MGSSGTHSFTDYPGSNGGRPNSDGGGNGGGGGSGGSSDRCENSITALALEEVATADYYSKHNAVPTLTTKVFVRRELVGSRVALATVSDNEVIGYVPTAYNYLRQCIQKGWTYEGTVTRSISGRVPQLSVDLSATLQ